MLIDCTAPDLSTHGTEISGVGPVGGDGNPWGRGISAAINFSLTDGAGTFQVKDS